MFRQNPGANLHIETGTGQQILRAADNP
jgi:hypothetical protein